MASTAFSKTGQEFLLNRINYERSVPRPQTLCLQRMTELLDRLGNPQQSLRIIHVAGTKGKGSTCHYTETILRTAGYRTGLYTSPHLEELGERFRIDGRPASPSDVDREIAHLRPTVEAMDELGRAPTFFELTTALAFHFFARQSVQFAVVEVGLGGRLDSTNVCDPLVTAITSISHDHTAILGATLEEIAAEKAGIVKSDRPVFTSVQQPEVLDCIEQIANQRSAPIHPIGTSFSFAPTAAETDHSDTFEVAIPGEPATGAADLESASTTAATSRTSAVYSDLQLSVHGIRQRENAALAVAICHHISELGWSVSPHDIRAGLASTKIPARIEFFSESPHVVVDVAHNEASFHELTSSLERRVTQDRRVTREGGVAMNREANLDARRLIFSSSRDKDSEAMLRCASKYFDEVILTRFQTNPRASNLEPLDDMAKRYFTVDAVHSFESPSEAWQFAWSQTRANDLLCIAGSFFIAAELLPNVREATRDARRKRDD
jgi:dihydrofolate synthase/folylpolyglutamate synthase